MFENINFEKVVVSVGFILTHVSWLAFYSLLLYLVFVIPKYIFSAARSIIAHIMFFIEVGAICLFLGLKLSVKRLPFASFFKLAKNCDFRVTDGNYIYNIRVLSLISPFRTALTVSPDGVCFTYINSPSHRKRVSEEGAFYLSSREMLGFGTDRRVKLPEFAKEKSNMVEVFLVCPKPLLISCSERYGELYGIEEINGILCGYYRDFYKYLRNINDNSKHYHPI